MKTHVTVEEAARQLEVTPVTVREYIKAGYLKGAKLRRRWMIASTEIERLLTEGVKPAEATA